MDEIGIGKERASDGRVFAPKNRTDFPPKINDNETTLIIEDTTFMMDKFNSNNLEYHLSTFTL
jgi:hypothetical protein